MQGRTRRWSALGACVAGLFAVSVLGTSDHPASPTAATVAGAQRAVSAQRAAVPPDVVVIYTDDQRADDVDVMTTVRAEIMGKGVNFANGMVVNAWCCPSRATVLTGRYSHGTGVYRNSAPFGGYGSFRDQSTLATALQAKGYRTGLVGKYLNGYNGDRVPPGWDNWVAFTRDPTNSGGAFYNYQLRENAVLRSYGARPADYSTDVLAARASSFIRGTPAGSPLFLYFTPFAPHTPYTPAPRHVGALAGRPFPRPPSYNEADVSDKPAYVRALPRLTAAQQSAMDGERRHALETLLAVDEAVAGILRALQDTGRLANTLIVFAGDNGLLRGEHRFTSKMVPYEESIRVPLAIRYDPLTTQPRTDPHLVLNMDIPVTIADLAGTTLPAADGRSVRPLLASGAVPWRSDFLVEHLTGGGSDPVPSYCASRSRTAKYVRYSTGEEELYNLVGDPRELTNRASDPAAQQQLSQMRARTKVLCTPLPPGYTWP